MTIDETGFERTETRTNGRRIEMWCTRPPVVRSEIPIVIAPAFAAGMHHFGKLASYFAHNGLVSYRYDPVDHVGLSEGEMIDFTFGGAIDSLNAAIEATRVRERVPRVGIVATSLSARVAYQVAAENQRVAFVVSAVGVVNLRRTLARTFGTDFFSVPPETWPDTVEFERQKVGREFMRDAMGRSGWLELADTIEALKRAPQPIVNFTAEDDDWVDPKEVEEAFTKGTGGVRRVYRLLSSGHNFARNLSAARTFLKKTTEEVLALVAGEAGIVVEPSFSDMTKQGLVERRLQRAANA
jgi:acyl transferase